MHDMFLQQRGLQTMRWHLLDVGTVMILGCLCSDYFGSEVEGYPPVIGALGHAGRIVQFFLMSRTMPR